MRVARTLTLLTIALFGANSLSSQEVAPTKDEKTVAAQSEQTAAKPRRPVGPVPQLLSRAGFQTAAAARIVERPLKWPRERRWSPRRFFGPFHGNSPKVNLNLSAGMFLYDRYFISNPDAFVFQKYYGANLPSNPISQPQGVPGTVPQAGFGNVYLNFERLTYSSRYGGSIRLSFLSMHDVQVEYRQGSVAWDIRSLEMSAYVRPVATYFNPNAPLFSVPDGSVHVEFRPQGVVAYTVSANNTLDEQVGDPLPALMTGLRTTAQAIVGGTQGAPFRLEATRFTHGLVHAAFWEDIGHTQKVTGIDISDGVFIPSTTAAWPTALVTVQVIEISLNTEPGDEEINITVGAAHVWSPSSTSGFSFELPEINDHESTSQVTVGVFPLDWDCRQLETLQMSMTVLETDTFSDDRFTTDPSAFQTGMLDCEGMETAFQNGQLGQYGTDRDDRLLLIDGDGDVAGAMTVRTRIFVRTL